MRRSINYGLGFWMSLILIGVIAILMYHMNPGSNTQHPRGDGGIYDYTGISFGQQKYVRIHGDAQFYWNQLLTPQEIIAENIQPDTLVSLPGYWNQQQLRGEKLPPKGCATYQFLIRVPEPGIYGIKIQEFLSAYRIWADTLELNGAGTVGYTAAAMEPSWKRQDNYFYTHSNEIVITLQISNFQHRNGGASDLMLFGKANPLLYYRNAKLGLEYFLLGVLFLLVLYHSVLFSFLREEKSLLYFSLFCLMILLRMGTTGEKILVDLFPGIPWILMVRVEYLSFILATPALLIFIHSLIPDDIPDFFLKIIISLSLPFGLTVIFLPLRVFSWTPVAFQFVLYLSSSYLLIHLIRAVLRKRNNALALLSGYLVLYIVLINDLLYFTGTLQSSFLIHYGIFVLIISQMVVLSRNISTTYLQVSKLHRRLERYNRKLESIVTKRTRLLSKQKSEIEIQKVKIENQADILKATNERLMQLDKFKRDMNNMMIHDLKTPLANIIGFSALDNFEDKYRKLINASANEMKMLIANIMDVNKYESVDFDLYKTNTNLYDIVQRAYKQSQYLVLTQRIQFTNELPKDLNPELDEEVMVRVFTNILSNATKFNNEKGIIRVSSEIEDKGNGKQVKVCIYNSGDAIPADKLDAIFRKYTQVYAQRGQYSFSTGIGLAFCKLAVEAHGGTIGVVSDGVQGATFWFTLPL